MDKWIDIDLLEKYPEATDSIISEALDMCMEQVKNNLPAFEEHFPAANSEGNFYTPGINTDWTSGFWTGEVWLSYENAKNEKDKELFERAGKKQVDSFLERINIRHYIDHHDMGFLYIPSCVAAYSLISYENAKEAAIKAADQLCSRYRPEGKYIQAWGEMWARDNARLIIDCMLNVPLLYWASEVTSDEHYAKIAKNHILTTMKHIIEMMILPGIRYSLILIPENFLMVLPVRGIRMPAHGPEDRHGEFMEPPLPIRIPEIRNI